MSEPAAASRHLRHRMKKLPQKLLVLHQFRLSMIRNESKLDTRHDQIRLLIHMDGQGTPH